MDVSPVERFGCHQQPSFCLGWHSHGRGNGPHTGTQCSGNGAHDLMGIFAWGHQGALAVTAPDLGLPAEGLERCGELCQA